MTTTTTRNGRPPTGSPKWSEERQRWEVRVTLPGTNGKKKRIPLPGIAQEDVDRARRVARLVGTKAQKDGMVASQSAETVNEYIDRWLEAREDRGLSTVSTDRGRLVKWVLPSIGTTEVAAVTRAQLEALVAKLDRSVLAGDMAWKTAGNVWGLVTKLFDDARKSKRADLRMREDNPADEVQGPDRGERKAKQYLWPSEFLALVSCPHVPVRMRRAYVLAVYLYARAGEIKALDWADVDLERGVVHIHKSVNRETGELTTTKSGESRRLPLEKELLPLLTAMHTAAKGKGPVLGLDGTETHLARQLRYHLDVAGVTRAELFHGDANRKAMSFHDLRATGVSMVRCAGRRSPPHQATRRAQELLHDRDLHPRSGEPLGRVRRGVSRPSGESPSSPGVSVTVSVTSDQLR